VFTAVYIPSLGVKRRIYTVFPHSGWAGDNRAYRKKPGGGADIGEVLSSILAGRSPIRVLNVRIPDVKRLMTTAAARSRSSNFCPKIIHGSAPADIPLK
jgi:hypothetical protein